MADMTAVFAKIFSAANTVVRPLLKSRLHSALSGRLMLLSYTGGKTGAQYEFPVGYFPWDDGDVLAFSSANWPKKLESARDVRVLIKKQWFAAQPTMVEPAERRADLLADFAKRNGVRAAGRAMSGVPGDREPTREELLTAANGTALVRFALTP